MSYQNETVEILKRRTDNIMLLKLVLNLIMLGGNTLYHQENAKNGISKFLDFEIFWGACPQSPLKVQAFGALQLSVIRKVWLWP